ncbi:unnamed protein product [Prorocentrum cordatum]|uniref:Uncharacterized protein n=1 Tax=Prorocentrum cordatum TaxID=2364126 RepID=A0ABN9WIE1_9DINO|nr:unnamed protein product [Polarella glacialis]
MAPGSSTEAYRQGGSPESWGPQQLLKGYLQSWDGPEDRRRRCLGLRHGQVQGPLRKVQQPGRERGGAGPVAHRQLPEGAPAQDVDHAGRTRLQRLQGRDAPGREGPGLPGVRLVPVLPVPAAPEDQDDGATRRTGSSPTSSPYTLASMHLRCATPSWSRYP